MCRRSRDILEPIIYLRTNHIRILNKRRCLRASRREIQNINLTMEDHFLLLELEHEKMNEKVEDISPFLFTSMLEGTFKGRNFGGTTNLPIST